MSRHCVQCDRFLRFSGGNGASSALSSALTGEFVDASLEQWSATCRVPLPLCLHCLRATGNGISSYVAFLLRFTYQNFEILVYCQGNHEAAGCESGVGGCGVRPFSCRIWLRLR